MSVSDAVDFKRVLNPEPRVSVDFDECCTVSTKKEKTSEREFQQLQPQKPEQVPDRA